MFLLVLLSPPSARAQGPNLPPPRSANQTFIVEKKVEQEAERPLAKKGKTPEIKDEIAKKKPKELPQLRFFVSTIELEGNRTLPTEELRPLVLPYEGKEQSMNELSLLTQTIEQEYVRRGYVTSIAYIPAQRIEKGIFKIRIVEGKVGEIKVEGNRYFRTKRILSYARIEKGEILRYQDIRKAITKLNQNPDREVRAILRKGTRPETTDIIFDVKDRFPLHAGFLYDNQGTDSSGKQRFGFTLRDSNLTGFDDILYGGTIFGKDFGAVFSQYMFPLPGLNTKLNAGFTHSQVNPMKTLKPFGVNGISQSYYGKIEHRLISGDRVIVDLNLGMEFKESRTKILSGTFYRERLRILQAGSTVHLQDRWGTTDLDAGAAFGIKGLGAAIYADPANSRQGVTPGFCMLTGNLFRAQRMPWETLLTFRAQFQFPTQKLTSSEALYMGGASSIRGYPEGDYLADEGFIASVEYLVPFFFLPADWKLPKSGTSLQKQIELVTFLDEGYGRLRGPSSTEAANRHMMGAGTGLRIRLYKNIYARTEWAWALGAFPLSGKDRYEFHFRLQAEV
ncbi:MAG TPA: ShlB/FhaC/HecB family hemolysin secretion/activation protein [Candidatus Omnitrophota bacterium]|nr:ShlB/FhaC/HecB family hemolysin secretion/activation protein [Candidatus Omnitrophota bacterium]